MPDTNTKIKFRRSDELNVENLDNQEHTLVFGEPLLIDTSKTGTERYLVLGPVPAEEGGSTKIRNSIFFRGMNKDQADKVVIFNEDEVITDLAGRYLKTSRAYSTSITEPRDGNNRYYLLAQQYKKPGTDTLDDGSLYKFVFEDNIGIYIDDRGVLHGAAWNDYAETRFCEDAVVPCSMAGRVVSETGKGTLKLSSEKLQPCSYIVSDTYGITMGEEGNVQIAVAGKVLVYTDDEVELGDCLTAGPDGKAVKMTRQEIVNYPDRIIGTVIEVPEYTEYKGKNIEGRVWVSVK